MMLTSFCTFSTDTGLVSYEKVCVRQNLKQLLSHLGQRVIHNIRTPHFWDLTFLEEIVCMYTGELKSAVFWRIFICFKSLIFFHALFSLQLSIKVSLHM